MNATLLKKRIPETDSENKGLQPAKNNTTFFSNKSHSIRAWLQCEFPNCALTLIEDEGLLPISPTRPEQHGKCVWTGNGKPNLKHP